MNYIYLWLDLFCISFPFILSFDKKVAFYKKWKSLFPAIAIIGLFFIIWDIIFTKNGIWEFNEKYLIGTYIYNLPVEEVLFFIFVPYSCVFIYACIKAYFSSNFLEKFHRKITLLLLFALPIIAILNADKAYTFYTSFFSWVLIWIQYYILKKSYMSWFYVAYIIHLIPFLIINGVLTYKPVVIYNNMENVGIRLYTIPIEDLLYSLFLFLGNIMIMELLEEKRNTKPFHN
ncbi:lycopene cyclase domain-containing protein [Cytophaga aurantiaca]|uniref:lycopene cyclase domain-containing protein n=1 Tax=Cytophaga aurantiaca TaxID=29530 RepID=UPI0003624DDF|nr:lycopene cyclase domain-containing protein [Cytophaga aurantiaca]